MYVFSEGKDWEGIGFGNIPWYYRGILLWIL